MCKFSTSHVSMKKEIEMLFGKLNVTLVATAIGAVSTFAATVPSFVNDTGLKFIPCGFTIFVR